MATLTKRQIDAADPTDRDRWLFDDTVTGFAVRIRPSGQKTFTFTYRLKAAGRAGQSRRVTIGSVGAITLDAARTEARKLAGAVAAGRDPASERDAMRAALAAERTVNAMLDAFLEDRTAHQKPRTVAEYRRLLARDVRPVIGAKKLSGVSRADVSALHRAMSDRPYMANNTLKTLTAAFTFAVAEGMTTTNPCAGITPYADTPRERFLTDDEFARLGQALRLAETVGVPVPEPSKRKKGGLSKARRAKLTGRKRKPYRRHKDRTPALHRANPDVIAAIRLLLFTGWREQEVLSLEWSMIDFQRGMVTLADSKTGRSHRPLGAQALVLLDDRERRGKYVFPSPVRRTDGIERPLIETSRTWNAVRHAAGLADVRLHDLRHSFASVSVGHLGLSLHLTAPLLGHVRTETTERYAHLANDPMKRAADAVSGRVATLLGDGVSPSSTPTDDPKVLSFAKRAS